MKNSTFVKTLDGRTRIDWWEKSDFKNRKTEIYSGDFGHMTLDTVIPIPDDVVLCDFCSSEITEYPVPVMGSYALCPVCFRDVQQC